MFQMCKLDKGLIVSIFLDQILVGEKYGLISFLEVVIEFGVYVDFEFFNGIMIILKRVSYNKNVYDKMVDNSIFLKFLKIDLKI